VIKNKRSTSVVNITIIESTDYFHDSQEKAKDMWYRESTLALSEESDGEFHDDYTVWYAKKVSVAINTVSQKNSIE